eukprot:TRINITY_DN20_c0_g1_i2.p1 TRINITY_DN20_c0_g1~~TRINITY_DN20_c0_g1_i2.p1  ORF type:complete len:369 (-),score=116.88 TRINITY_DN20_c0_g1_i2:70-1107(-)
MSAEDARRRWELENRVDVATDADAIFRFDPAAQAALSAKPWAKDPHYFKHVRMSAIALLKMVMHARSGGGQLEVMGLMVGKVMGDTMVVMDSFALPVHGTETRVNAGMEANEYMVEYLSLLQQFGRQENAIGWYHSHPGYGCWLSGIDVSTQLMYQQYQEPWLAVVIDPTRTISAGKVEIGAFRTYPPDYKAPDDTPSTYQTIPLAKIEDFGVHCKAYYPVPITYFKSSLDGRLLDLLWHKYWVNTLSSSPLLTNRGYTAGAISDLAEKLEMAESGVGHNKHTLLPPPSGSGDKKKDESQLAKLSRDSAKTATEQLHGMMSQVLKDLLFNQATYRAPPAVLPAHP